MKVKYVAGSTKRKDERYCGYAYIEGESKRYYVYDEDQDEMKRKLFALVDELENGIIRNDILFKNYVKKWLDDYCKNLSPTTRNTYTKEVNRNLLPYLGEKKVRDITFSDIQKILNNFGENHSEKSSKNLLMTMSTIMNCAILYDKIRKDNPCIGVKVKQTEMYQYDVYTIEEMQRFYNVVIGSEYEIPIVLASMCGLRLSEVCGLKWKDVDFTNKKINIRRAAVVVNTKVIIKVPKSKSSARSIAMPEYVVDMLWAKRGMPDAFVYPAPDGNAQNGVNLSKRIARFRKNHGFPHTRFHDFRHFNATAMLEANIPDKQAAANLGHADTNMTKKYQHILKSVEDRPAKLMDELLNPKAQKKEEEKSQVSKQVSK